MLTLSRILEGISSSVALSTFTAIFMILYPDKVGAIYSWSSTVHGLGYSIGPAIGGFLYDIGGFYLPFLAIGILDIVFSLSTLVALPKEECQVSQKAEKSGIFSSLNIIGKVRTHTCFGDLKIQALSLCRM